VPAIRSPSFAVAYVGASLYSKFMPNEKLEQVGVCGEA
jgi:hypothetical protein